MIAYSTARRFMTGSTPGSPSTCSSTSELGSAPKCIAALAAAVNILDLRGELDVDFHPDQHAIRLANTLCHTSEYICDVYDAKAETGITPTPARSSGRLGSNEWRCSGWPIENMDDPLSAHGRRARFGHELVSAGPSPQHTRARLHPGAPAQSHRTAGQLRTGYGNRRIAARRGFSAARGSWRWTGGLKLKLASDRCISPHACGVVRLSHRPDGMWDVGGEFC